VTSKRSATKAPKVWRIFRFKERFELSENIRKCRRSALEFSRDFVGDAGGDEAVGYQRQFALLSNGDGLEFGMLYGLYRLLVNMSAKQSRAFRGYLLDAKNQPLSDSQIGKLLKIETKRIRKILRRLASVDLLELVELPEFDMSVNEPPPEDDEPGDDNGSGKSNQKSADGNRKPQSGGRGRTRAENSAEGRKPLKEKGNMVNGNGKGINKEATKRRREVQSKAQEAPPPTTQPLKPQVSAERGSVIQFTAPSELKNTGRLGEIAEKILHRYNPQAKEFAFEVYKALELRWDPMSEQGKRELGCFASVWQKLAGWQNAGMPLPVINEIRQRAIDEARKIAKRRQNRKKGAVWCTVFENLAAAYKRRAAM